MHEKRNGVISEIVFIITETLNIGILESGDPFLNRSMNDYQNEQMDALLMVRRHLETLTSAELRQFISETAGYLEFRREVRSFLDDHFSSVCTRTCFHSRLSACCTREGIITFFADLEKKFIDAGLRSALMYLHNSPGLLRIKRKWQKA